jgi:multiple antibiotic resistance protein
MFFWPDGLGAFALLCISSLLAIVNPLAAAPVYLVLTGGYTPAHRRRTLRTAVLTSLVILTLFALLGGTIFQFFGITMDAFRITGGILVFAIGLDMLQAKRSRVKATAEEEEEGLMKDDVGVTPLGVPMIVGPGAITTVMVLMTQAVTTPHVVVVFASILVVLGSIYASLRAAPRLIALFGRTGLNVMTRLMGLLVAVIGVQFVLDGSRPYLTAILHGALGG